MPRLKNPETSKEKPYIIDGKAVTLEEYRQTKVEDIRLRVPKGQKEKIKNALIKINAKNKEHDIKQMSLNAFICSAIHDKIYQEIGEDLEL